MNTNNPVSIAVIDDHPIVVAGLQAMLDKEDSILILNTASSLAEYSTLNPVAADVVMLDLNIPGETYRDNISKAKTTWPQSKIVAYTSYSSSDLIRETMKLGCSGFVLKQINRTDLIEGIHLIAAGERFVSEARKATLAGRDRAAAEGTPNDDFQKRLLLSKREKEILHHISRGSTSQQIADALYISRYTVETHRKNILRKLNFNTSTELVKFAVQQGLV